MAGRPNSPTSQLLNVDDANGALKRMLYAQIDLEKLQGALDLERAAATSRFEKDIDERKSLIADITSQLQVWFLVSRERPLGEKANKSLKLAYGTIGERLGNPTLKPLNRKWSWKVIAVKLRTVYGLRFFHTAPEPAPDKEKLRTELTADELKDCGLMVERQENFYVELDRTSLGDPVK